MVTFDRIGPRLCASDIDQLAEDLGVELPEAYRRFLSRYNGGAPTPDTIDVPQAPGSPTDIQIFFGIGRSVDTSNLAWNLSLLKNRCPAIHALPVACDSGGNLFCLQYTHSGKSVGVIYCDLESADCATYEVADSFDEFLGKIRRYEEWPSGQR